MPVAGAFIDANLLVLFVVGSIDRNLVTRHRRTRRFTPDDFDRLADLIETLRQVFVMPNTLTEASNLLANRNDPRFLLQLRFLIERSDEIVVSSKTAASNRMFGRLGLSDAALLEAVSAERPLVTVDFDLYGAAVAKGEGVAYNFTYMQDL